MRSESPSLRRRRVLRGLLLVAGALVLLRQGIVALQQEVPIVAAQAALIEGHAIEPASLFYTENPLALRAEKQLRERLTAE